MIILITGTVVTGSNVTLKANGNNAWPATTTGSGAGGGAGGTILVDATEFQGPQFTVQVRGGNGSSTTTPGPNVNGAGGGGSGGVFWHSLPVSPLIILDSINGSGGITPTGSGNPLQLGLPGLQGVRLKELIVPLTGFLFNTIRGIDTICESQLPGILTASKPKGGDGNYTFVWQQSTDNLNWLPAIGEDEPRSFIPVALNQTTYYRRIVSSQSPLTMEAIHDTSRVIEVFVYPAIANNSISGTDTICYNNDAKILTGSAPAGGNSIYSYFWQMSSDLIQWNNTGNAPNYDPTQLTASTSYRRIINSTAYCSDTSNYIKIAVLPSITGNNFNITDTAICMNTSPGRILLNYPGGGDGEYAYKWESKTSSDWNSIPSTTDSVVYSEGILTEQTSYRRIVYSGFNNACIDTGNNYTVAVRPPVSNNIIGGSSIKYTCYNSPIVLNGSEPQNGFGPGTYAYAWEESENSTDWQEISQTNRDLQSDNLTSTRYFRRKVYSTPQYHECEDTSSFIEVRINPLPTGNVFSQSDTICAGSTLNVKFTLAGNGPFNVSVRGDVETARSLTGITGPSDSISFNPQITQEFVMVSVEDDSGCFADGSGFVPVVAGMVYENPIAIAGEDSESCGDTFILSATKTNSEYKGLWTASDAIFSDSTLENTNTTVSYYGPHVFKWTETNWHCTDDDEVEIIFYERPDIPDAGADQELNFKYTTSLQGSVPSIGNGIWSVISGSCDFSDLNDPNAIVSELSEETLIRWTVVNGLCPAVSDSLKIIINPLEIKKAFTPNGDGVNDYLNMGTASSVENINIRIFNRSGLPVFELDDQCIVEFSGIGECSVWDGKNQKNIDSPEGTYFYIAKIKVEGKENEVEFRSFVEIMR
jgi:gliding motility-associated-like protein